MDLRRVRVGEWAAAAAGVALLAISFLRWYSIEGTDVTGTAWQAFSVIDVVLAIGAAMAIGLAVTAATQRTPAVTQGLGALTVLVAAIATLLLVYRGLDLPGPDGAAREYGLYLGIAACVGIVAGAWTSINDQGYPAAVEPKVEPRLIRPPEPGAGQTGS